MEEWEECREKRGEEILHKTRILMIPDT